MSSTKFFQKTGVDISSPKSMFNFINGHYRYFTANSWNHERSIANNVKVYNLNLSGDPFVALCYLEAEEYHTINGMITDWQQSHEGYAVGFNGRSAGYLVLYQAHSFNSVVPSIMEGYKNYEDWRDDLKDSCECVCDYIYQLRELTELIRDFDKLCDDIREYVDGLSHGKFELDMMDQIVETFNDIYSDDLDLLGFSPLSMDEDGNVDVSEIAKLQSLIEVFQLLANRHKDQGYICDLDWKQKVARLKEKV